MAFSKDDFVKVVSPGGDYRYGYISETAEAGEHVSICFHEEGESKVEFDELEANAQGLDPPDWDSRFTPQERAVLPHLAAGEATKAIASGMGISPVTVRSYIRSLQLKLGLTERLQLVVYAQGLELFLNDR